MNLFNKQFWFSNLWFGENSHERNRARHFEGLTFDERAAIVSLVMPDTSRVWGIDISHWNLPPVNLKRMRDIYGLSFVIIKGCDGSLNSNYYPQHVAAAKEAGIPWGMYAWLYPGAKVNLDNQVNAWWARYSADPPPLGLFIDCEWTTYAGQAVYPNATDLRSAHNKWKIKSGEAGITYTAPGYANSYLIGFDWSREPLWVAHYGVITPALPKGATDYIIHQFTSTLDGKKLDPNGNAELDGNYYHGDWTPPTQPPPEPGGSMPVEKHVIIGTTKEKTAINNPIGTKTGNYVNAGTAIQSIAREDGQAESADGKWIHIPAGWINKQSVPDWHWITITVEEDPGGGTEPPPPTTTVPDYLIAYDASNNPLARYNKQ